MELYERKVFYYETDRMGFMHNSNYVRLFEEARLYHIDTTAMPYPEIEKGGLLVPVVGQSIRYHKSLHYGDTAQVAVSLVEFNGSRFKYKYEIYIKETGELSASGISEHCFLNNETRRPVQIRRTMPELFDKMKASVESIT